MSSESVRLHCPHPCLAQPCSDVLDLGTRSAWGHRTSRSCRFIGRRDPHPVGSRVRKAFGRDSSHACPGSLSPHCLATSTECGGKSNCSKKYRRGRGHTLRSGAKRQLAVNRIHALSPTLCQRAPPLVPARLATEGAPLFSQLVGANVCQGTLESMYLFHWLATGLHGVCTLTHRREVEKKLLVRHTYIA